jgi:hypothetical protein
MFFACHHLLALLPAADFLYLKCTLAHFTACSYSSTGKYNSLAPFYIPQYLCRRTVTLPGLHITTCKYVTYDYLSVNYSPLLETTCQKYMIWCWAKNIPVRTKILQNF